LPEPRGVYIVVGAPGHPLATREGNVLEHRLLLFEAIGWGPHSCHWCGDEIDWVAIRGKSTTWKGILVVDHLDNDCSNNELSNLLPSCNYCNAMRGTMLYFALRQRQD